LKRESLGLELSAFELGALSGIVQNQLQGWYVNNVYPLTDEGLLIRFHRAEMGNKNLALHPRIALWITSIQQLKEGEINEFCRLARKHLNRLQLDSCYAVRGERIVSLEFSHAGQKLGLFAEFFGAGNIIITDADRKILALLHEIDSKDRSLHPGSTYSLPKPKKATLDSISPDMLLKSAGEAAGLTKLIGRAVQLPDRILKEVVARSGLSEDSTINMDSATKLLSKLYELEEEANKSREFYIYEGEGKAILSSIQLTHLGNAAKILSAENIEEIFNPSLEERISASGTSVDFSRLEREKKRIESARKMYEATVNTAERLKEIAGALNSGQISLERAGEMLNSLNSSIRFENGVWTIEGRRRIFDNSYSLASQIFAESKRLISSASQIMDSIQKMEKALQKMERSGVEADKRGQAKQVKRKWFESFRWFLTSESFLAVGGRDAGSNSLLIRKKMEQEDLVFHAEVSGSPFFLLKRGKDAGQVSIVETATATVCYSRAWREGLTAADAYFVHPDQVKLGAPSGMYMARGSFMVEGQRNYVKNIKLILAVGVTKIDGEARACSGPTSSVSKYSPVVVEIVPGGMKPLAIAKKIIKLVEQHVENIQLPAVDEFLRVLPPGDSEIYGIKKGEGNTLPNF
jgi:predicted ribosome quality control (RQC) complex YloA/Tae2 family protein